MAFRTLSVLGSVALNLDVIFMAPNSCTLIENTNQTPSVNRGRAHEQSTNSVSPKDSIAPSASLHVPVNVVSVYARLF